MRAVILSWEYPPRVVGKLAEQVSALAAQLVKNRVETNVVTYNDAMTGEVRETSGVKVVRVANPVRSHVNVLTWVLTLNQEVERAAANIYYQAGKNIDVIDVHDWHFIPAAVTLKNALRIPFVYSVDSLEDHRSQAASAPLNMAIRGIEWLGFYEAQKVIVKSDWMQSEIIRIYSAPKEKIFVRSVNGNGSIKEILNIYKTTSGGSRTK
jgi:glycogen(starch) synthase